ncbi:hypothetical protein [Bacterioplanoides sp.]|uniref:hypothetical protein n=1 Tax=Bacterioplanoides sp. TaxID=2066072 RepID=UPI003AFFD3F2
MAIVSVISNKVVSTALTQSKRLVCAAACLLLISMSLHAREDILLRESFAGNLSFETTGNSLRDENDECSVLNSSTATIRLPANSVIQKASLYWSGSGTTVDSAVTFSGTPVTASVTYTETFVNGAESFDFFSAKADVTSLVSNATSRSYSVSDLSFDGTGLYCQRQAAYGGWALVIVYENAAEPLRVINIFDGFQSFRGQSITLVPNNFVIGNPNNGGKHAHITWEGDQANSTNLGAFSETLTFNNNVLSHGNDNPANNQFNSVTRNTLANSPRNTSGVDIDVYEIGRFLSAGATSVSTTYSSGGDLVLLSAEIISVPNTEVADLSFATLSGSSAFKNSTASIDLSINNNGPNNSQANTEIRFPLPADTRLNSFSGDNWQCNTASNEVLCVYAPVINNDQQSTALQIILDTGQATPSGDNTFAVSITNAQFDNIQANNSANTNIRIDDIDLSQSQKSVLDLNGGNVEAGDVLRYTFTIREASGKAVDNLILEDTFPDLYREIAVVRRPNGSTRSNNNQLPRLTVSNITLAAATTARVIVDVVIRDDIPAGTLIENSAILKRDSSEQVITAPTLTVSERFLVTETGNKPLYLYKSNLMSRLPPSGDSALGELAMARSTEYRWNITPVLQQDLLLSPTAGGVVVKLRVQHRAGRQGSLGQIRRNHELSFRLEKEDGSVIASATRGRVFPRNNDVVVYEYHIPYEQTAPSQDALTIPAGSTLQLVMSQNLLNVPENNNITDNVFLFFANNLDTSQVILPVVNTINIENIQFYDKPFSDDSRQLIVHTNLNRPVYINALVSDPFGSFDITSAAVSIHDAADEQILAATAMVQVADSQAAEKTYEYAYPIPALIDNPGDWNITVTAREGLENTVTDQQQQILEVRQILPDIRLTKSSFVLNDPINGTDNPKAIPGSEVVYQLKITNTGAGRPDSDTLSIDEEVPAGLPLFVGDFVNASPVSFIQGTTPNDSGISFNFSSLSATDDDLAFSQNGGADGFTYTPVPDANGYDSKVTHIRFMPKGELKAADIAAGSQPEFRIQYKVKVQ